MKIPGDGQFNYGDFDTLFVSPIDMIVSPLIQRKANSGNFQKLLLSIGISATM